MKDGVTYETYTKEGKTDKYYIREIEETTEVSPEEASEIEKVIKEEAYGGVLYNSIDEVPESGSFDYTLDDLIKMSDEEFEKAVDVDVVRLNKGIYYDYNKIIAQKINYKSLYDKLKSDNKLGKNNEFVDSGKTYLTITPDLEQKIKEVTGEERRNAIAAALNLPADMIEYKNDDFYLSYTRANGKEVPQIQMSLDFDVYGKENRSKVMDLTEFLLRGNNDVLFILAEKLCYAPNPMVTTTQTTSLTTTKTTTTTKLTTVNATTEAEKPVESAEPVMEDLGDANNDGKITSEDATAVLIEFASELLDGTANRATLPENLCKYDVNRDGKVTSEDATCILIYYASSLLDKNVGPIEKFDFNK